MLVALLIAAAAPSGFIELAGADGRLVTVGRRLALGGAGLCAGTVSNPGWTIADVEQYAPAMREGAKSALGLGALPTVIGVEPNSPAADRGIKIGDELLGVGTLRLTDQAMPKMGRARLKAIEAAPARQIQFRRQGRTFSVTLNLEPGCPSHFVIGRASGLRGVSSSGGHVGVSAEMLDYVANDDELALILAHELAHNILGHNKGVPSFRAAGEDRSGRSKKSREVEADRWALYLMARAGYDVSVAPGFWRRWGPKTSFGIFNAGSHPGWRDRAVAAEAEIARIKAQQQAGQQPVP